MGHTTPAAHPQTAGGATAPAAHPQTVGGATAPAASPQMTSGATSPPLPAIIQGGMGVAVSDWRLANAVARTGQLGVVSGTAVDVMCVRRLQDGDPGGHVRRALARFPVPEIAQQLVETYHLDGGRGDGVPYRNIPMFSARPARRLQELAVAAGFVEVFLAKEGHDGPVGINLLRKIEAPIPFVLYGAMLAGVDAVLVGAGNPHELPGLMDDLAVGSDIRWSLRVQQATHNDHALDFSPAELFGGTPPVLRRPRFLAIVASNDLAEGLATSPTARPDGFVVEGPPAGGHNAPPRGPRRLDERDQPIYDAHDEVDLPALAALGLPFWLAGRYGTPAGLQQALAAGAVGVQVGTVFALCEESGMAATLKRDALAVVRSGDGDVRTDWRVSPTGFPFKVLSVPGTLSEPDVFAGRERICDLGMLRVPYEKQGGSLGYRCPAEPVASYTGAKGAREANTHGRVCLCNALLATAGVPQSRTDGSVEPALATLGTDLTPVVALLDALGGRRDSYTAAEVVDYLLGR
jgi:NAD(P)H-dependent flavin oxidoreductase YrpB (nitropropane dioxygenase family)